MSLGNFAQAFNFERLSRAISNIDGEAYQKIMDEGRDIREKRRVIRYVKSSFLAPDLDLCGTDYNLVASAHGLASNQNQGQSTLD